MGSGVKLIDPRSVGLRGLELRRPLFDEATLVKADDTLTALGQSMAPWLEADLERLQATRLYAEAASWSFEALDALMGAAHDLKGMGGTYGFPIVTRLAASLCKLIETEAGKALAQKDPALVCAHVDALRAAVRDGVQDTQHPVGRALVSALEEHVERLGVAPR